MKLRLALLGAAIAIAVAACSGGGTTSPAPSPTPTVPGKGYSGAFSASVAFSIIVPSEAMTQAIRRRAKALQKRTLGTFAATPAPSPSGQPYISPLVGWIQITPIAVNGSSLAIAQLPVTIAGGCPASGSGCTLTATVPAAPGAVNRYFIQTYASSTTSVGGFGPLISSGYVDVTVPAAGNASQTVGGATVSIGGYVAGIAFSPSSATVAPGVASTTNVIVETLDASGAVILQNTYYAEPVSLTSSDTTAFSINGAAALTLSNSNQQQIAVQYSGGNSLGTVIVASSVDSNGNPVTARLPIAVVAPTPSPTPTASPTPTESPTPTSSPTRPGSTPTPVSTHTPTPTPTHTPTPSPTPTPMPTVAAMSIYAIDADNDNIVEYDVVNKLLNNTPVVAPTPRRVVQFNSAALPGSVTCSDASPSGAPPLEFLGGMIVDSGGRILVQSSCTDGTSTYVYQYPGTATGAPTPVSFAAEPYGYVNYAMSAAASPGRYYFTINNNYLAPFAYSPTGTLQAQYFTDQCYAELGQPATCQNDGPGSYEGQSGATAADASGNLYVSQNYQDNLFTSGNPPLPITPPGPGSAPQYTMPPTISIYSSANGTVPSALPFLDIAGLNSLLGGTGGDGAPASLAIDGSTLYVLTSGQVELGSTSGGTIYPGLSGCPAPSSNAPLNGATIHCADGNAHSYLLAFNISTVLNVANFGLDVELTPIFAIGGDTVGRFGENEPLYSAQSAQELAVSKGIVAVANVPPEGSSSLGEIDVYNTNGVTGSHTDIAPSLVIPNIQTGAPTLFQTVAIGPTGSGTGGLSLLLRRNQHVGRIRHVHVSHRR
jgi:hypothetical protein